VKTGDQGFSQGITEIVTLKVSNRDTQVIPRDIFDTRPRLVTSCKLLVQMRVFEKPQSGGSSILKIFQKLELEVLQFRKMESEVLSFCKDLGIIFICYLLSIVREDLQGYSMVEGNSYISKFVILFLD
jgi:hypothetical protein